MKIKGNLLRVLFGVNFILFVYSALSPWAWKTTPSMFERPPWPLYSGEEWYWSFQVILYNLGPGYKIMPIEWDFWFNPAERAVRWDF